MALLFILFYLFILICEDKVQTLLMLKVLFTLEDIFVKYSSSSKSSLFFSNNLFWLGLEPVQDDFHYGFTRMTEEADGSVVPVEL